MRQHDYVACANEHDASLPLVTTTVSSNKKRAHFKREAEKTHVFIHTILPAISARLPLVRSLGLVPHGRSSATTALLYRHAVMPLSVDPGRTESYECQKKQAFTKTFIAPDGIWNFICSAIVRSSQGWDFGQYPKLGEVLQCPCVPAAHVNANRRILLRNSLSCTP